MRILHVSDMHCATDKLKRLLELSDNYDLILATGDFQCVDTAGSIIKLAGKVYAVTGNMDDPAIARLLRDSGILLDGRITEFGTITIAGLGGLDFHSSLSSLRDKLGKSGSRINILLSHHPPKGILDRAFFGLRAGLRELKDFVNEIHPRLHLFGHIHEARGVHDTGTTIFVNPGPLKKGYYAIIECDEKLETCNVSLEKL